MISATTTMGPGCEEARARLRPGNFQGHVPRRQSRQMAAEAVAALGATEGKWFRDGRYRRQAAVTSVSALTSTGTVRIGFEVIDGAPFHFDPGQFVGIEAHFDGLGYRRSPYCILSAPRDEPVFELLVRVVPQGVAFPPPGLAAPRRRGRLPGPDGAIHGPPRR